MVYRTADHSSRRRTCPHKPTTTTPSKLLPLFLHVYQQLQAFKHYFNYIPSPEQLRHSSGMSLINHLALEMTYKAAAPHISAFVRALHRHKPHQSVCVISRSMDHDKVWRRRRSRQYPSGHVSRPNLKNNNNRTSLTQL